MRLVTGSGEMGAGILVFLESDEHLSVGGPNLTESSLNSAPNFIIMLHCHHRHFRFHAGLCGTETWMFIVHQPAREENCLSSHHSSRFGPGLSAAYRSCRWQMESMVDTFAMMGNFDGLRGKENLRLATGHY